MIISSRLNSFIRRTRFICLGEYQLDRRVFGDVNPGPVDEDNYFVSDAENEHQMQKHPDKTRKISLKPEKGKINYCFVPANGCHGTKVFVFIIHRRFFSDNPFKVLCQIFPLVDGNISQLGMSFRVFWCFHIGNIANGKNIFASGNFVYLVYLYPVAMPAF